MKKNFWSFLAVLFAALFVSATAVQAADISFGGQLLERAQYDDKNEEMDAADWSVAQRLRLNTTVKASGVTMFSQMTHTHTWGTNVGPGTDGNEDVGVHQAHLTMPNFFGTGWTAKLGRQEVVLDGHRIFGHTGWALDAVTHDAATLVNPAWDLTYVLSYMANATAANTNDDQIAHVFRKGLSLAGGKTALYYVAVDDSSTSAHESVLWHPLGIRQTGKAAGYDYRVEYYHQSGQRIPAVTGVGSWVANRKADVDAFMFGARIGKKVNNTKVTLWYDYVSGNENSDADGNDWAAFDVLYDTGHKFYGLIDGINTTTGVDYLGLQDYAVKLVHPVAPGWTLKADYHVFMTAVSPADNRTAWSGESGNSGNDCDCADRYLGDEIDLTLKNKYNANTSVQFGYSWLNGSETFHNINTNADNEQQHWAYAQVNFTY